MGCMCMLNLCMANALFTKIHGKVYTKSYHVYGPLETESIEGNVYRETAIAELLLKMAVARLLLDSVLFRSVCVYVYIYMCVYLYTCPP